MNGPRRTLTRAVGWTVAGVLAVATASLVGVAFAGSGGSSAGSQNAGGGAFLAATDTSTASPTSPGQPNAPRHRWPGRRFESGPLGAGIGRGLLHGEFVVKDQNGKVVTMVAQHGTVTAVSPTSITLKSSDGFTGTYAVNNDTRVRVGGGPAAITGAKTGAEAWVLAIKGSPSTARIVVVRDS